VTNDPYQLRHAMTERLVAGGVLPDRRWHGIVATVARYWFLTEFFHPLAEPLGWELVDPAHPRWLALAHTDTTHPIQLGDVSCRRPRPCHNTSWATRPDGHRRPRQRKRAERA
jgi:hypothetical protein